MTPARASAAVILLRDRDGDTEVFMGQRHGRATFASTYVFPGGVVAPDDARSHDRCQGPPGEEADRRLAVTAGGLDFYSAAIRELFEETGVLLATAPDGEWLSGARSAVAISRRGLAAGELDWAALLGEWGARLATDCLHYVGHWETPVALTARFSTRFFVADLPPGQEPEHDGAELVDSRWLKPADALALNRTGEIELPFPHMKHLERLAEFTTTDALRRWARERWREPVVRIRPWIVEEAGRRRFLLPGDPGYPDHA